MKLFHSIAIFSALAFSSSAFAQVFTAQPAQSSVQWKGEKLTGFHEGAIALKSGSITLKGNTITSAAFAIDMASITCTDIAEAESNASLVGHLKSGNFFGSAAYPEASFTLTEKIDISKPTATVNGNLTIKGITKPISFKAVIRKDAKGGISIIGNLSIDRTKYGIQYGSGSIFDNLGDKVIYDEFQVKLNIVAKQQ